MIYIVPKATRCYLSEVAIDLCNILTKRFNSMPLHIALYPAPQTRAKWLRIDALSQAIKPMYIHKIDSILH